MELTCDSPSLIFEISSLFPCFSKASISGESKVMKICFISSLSRLHAYPIFTAVSILSPVKTHILIPACASLSMHSGTPFCSLSSTAVAPRRTSSLSILSAIRSTNTSLSAVTVVLAFINSVCQVLYSSSPSSRNATTKVRKPASAYFLIHALVSASNIRPSFESLSNITLSAPLERSNS
uniref:Phospholipid-transporting ATPase n=2 Tax=Rhizophora mucronata TaxID=61149 RepID=A0A2P2MIH6_RHIMU